MSHLLAAGGRLRVCGKMCSKQAAKQITDLNGSKSRQHLQGNNQRTFTSPNANGANDRDRQRKQHESDHAKTQSENQSGRSGQDSDGQHDVPPCSYACPKATASVLFYGRKTHNSRELANIRRCHFSDTSECGWMVLYHHTVPAVDAAVTLQVSRTSK